jgi:Holliday junction resolvasome RuvABC endonuclease subunit
MRVLALDQASRTSGWAVFDDGKLVTYGKFTADQADVGDRLHFIRMRVSWLIDDYDIDEVVFEDIQLQGNVANNVATFKALAEVFGVLYELFVMLKLPRTAVLSTVWKSTLGIKGKDRAAQKKAAQAWVEKTYGVKPTQDECDAICIGAHYVNNKVEVFDWS